MCTDLEKHWNIIYYLSLWFIVYGLVFGVWSLVLPLRGVWRLVLITNEILEPFEPTKTIEHFEHSKHTKPTEPTKPMKHLKPIELIKPY
jgi:hypothetical protein